jgi:hypothetical protein
MSQASEETPVSSEHSSVVRVAQVRVSEYGVNYQVLAIWDSWAWVLVYGVGIDPMQAEPKTMSVSWLADKRLKYDLRPAPLAEVVPVAAEVMPVAAEVVPVAAEVVPVAEHLECDNDTESLPSSLSSLDRLRKLSAEEQDKDSGKRC